jgi:hypothetical protein
LGFTAGEIWRPTAVQLSRIHQFEHLAYALVSRGAVEAVKSISNVGVNAEMREESGLLSNQRGMPMTWFEPKAELGVGERLMVEHDVRPGSPMGAELVQPGKQTK